MKILAAVLAALLFPIVASAAPIVADTWLTLESHPDGAISVPYYGLRLDGLEGDDSEEYTFDFSDSRSDMRLYYDSTANTIQIKGHSWGGEDIGSVYRDGGTSYQIEMLYEQVMDLGSVLEVAPGGGNTGSISGGGITSTLVDVAGSHSYSFRIADEHRGAGPSGWGWVNHSGRDHVYSSDWLFVVGDPIPEPSGALLFAAGALVIGGVR
ncbi:MAG: hypothetical protein JRE71_15230, partial [Deltaproteobacteria bacterium]|nr:hypothetical protein [Deltaproteobacteria bacterium]